MATLEFLDEQIAQGALFTIQGISALDDLPELPDLNNEVFSEVSLKKVYLFFLQFSFRTD